MIVGPSHTFAQFAVAIDAAFARWDLSHLHEFRAAGWGLVGYPDDSFEPDVVWLDQAKLRTRTGRSGDQLQFGQAACHVACPAAR
jgi:hypothetical protein